MSAYSDRDWLAQRGKTFVVEPFEEKAVTPLGYDLTVGYALTWKDVSSVDSIELSVPTLLALSDADGSIAENNKSDSLDVSAVKNNKLLHVPPKTGFIVVTAEKVYLSGCLTGEVKGKASISAKGIFLNPVTIDPNFGRDGGRLIFYLYNASDKLVQIKERDAIATLTLHVLRTTTRRKPRTSSFIRTLEHYRKIYGDDVAKMLSAYVERYADSEGDCTFEEAAAHLEWLWNMHLPFRKAYLLWQWVHKHWRIGTTILVGGFLTVVWIALKDDSWLHNGWTITTKLIELLGAVLLTTFLHQLVEPHKKDHSH